MIPRPGRLGRPSASPARVPATRHEAAQPPALGRAELLLAGQGRKVGSRPLRVPQDAFVPVAPNPFTALPGRKWPALAAPSPATGANDNAEAAPSRRRTVLRELVFLLIFAATLAGTYYIGRMNAATNVIVVPGPSSHRSVVT